MTRMFCQIACFELRYQLRNPVFWVASGLIFLLTFAAMTIDQAQIGGGGNIHRNAPVAIAQIYLIMSIYFMFVTTAFVANVIVRDDDSGFGPMVRSTSVSKFDYLFGRFTGALGAAAMSFLVVPIAIWAGTQMPWLPAETLGPNRLYDHLYAYGVLALPNIFMTSAMFFALATVTRSMMYSYLGVVVFIVIYLIIVLVVQAQPEAGDLASYIEAFGYSAFGRVTRYWTASESNAVMPPLEGALLANRLIWFALACVALGAAFSRFTFAERAVSRRKLERQQAQVAQLAATMPLVVDRLPAARPEAAAGLRLVALCRMEMSLIVGSPAFIVLLILGLLITVVGLTVGGELYGTPVRPLTFAVIGTLQDSFGIFPLIVAIYCAGELVWRDRDRRMHEIVDATSLPNWAYMVPKSLAVAGVLFAMMLSSVITAILVQVARGQADLHLGQYLGWYLIPATFDMTILAILTVFVQALSPNKYVGWLVMILYLVATITLTGIGLEHPLYLYGNTGKVLLSDMNGDQIGGARAWWLRLYWGAFALALSTLAHLLWRRGTAISLKSRLVHLPRRLVSTTGLVLVGALVVAVASGAYLFYEMNVLNTHRTKGDGDEWLANYEKKYLKYSSVLQPSLTDIQLNVQLYPSERRMEASGTYRFINNTGEPLNWLHIRLPSQRTKLIDISVPGARLSMNDAMFKYRIYRFEQPLEPGAVGTLNFRTQRWQQGMVAGDDDTKLIANGTFLDNFEILPQLGMNRSLLLKDRDKRRKFGLPPELNAAKLNDGPAQAHNYFNVDWVRSDITLSTSADQTPIAPGRKVDEHFTNGRRVARFVADTPILAFFSIQSAAYAQKSRMADGVNLTVFYEPKHSFNVDRMLNAMQTSLAYYRSNFGPYQFDYARIVEFPGYETFAQAFAGTMPYSERLGFIADTRDPEKIDYVTYVTAHEFAHQYWGHQMMGADMQGATLLTETLAQYSALMVMKSLYGDDKIRRFLKFELDNYLSGRGADRTEERPLNQVEDQPYIHYRKGSLVMYLLQDRFGEARVNAVLAHLLERHRFRGAPYMQSAELVDGFLSLAQTASEKMLVVDLFDRITVYDLKAVSATVRGLPNGTFETLLRVDASKFYANGSGVEQAAALLDDIEVGVFDQRPDFGAFAAKDVILKERQLVKSGVQVIRFVTKRRPVFAGIDPYNKYVDRNSEDNMVAVSDR